MLDVKGNTEDQRRQLAKDKDERVSNIQTERPRRSHSVLLPKSSKAAMDRQLCELGHLFHFRNKKLER